jgi:cell division protein FtsN
MPKLVVESTIEKTDDMETLVESIEEDLSLNEETIDFLSEDDNTKVVQAELMSINTNSREKIVIPQKINQIDVELSSTINSEKQETSKPKEENKEKVLTKQETTTINKPLNNTKGMWYAQIIASSSRSAVENLWKNMLQKHSFLKSYYYEVEEITAANGNTLYRLKVGSFKTRKQAEELANKLKQNNISSIIKQN